MVDKEGLEGKALDSGQGQDKARTRGYDKEGLEDKAMTRGLGEDKA